MEAVVDPASEAIFDAAIWDNGVQVGAPKGDLEWEALRNHAINLAEAGNLLMMAPRAIDQAGWMSWARALVDAGVLAQKAAEAQSVDAVFQAGGQTFELRPEAYRSLAGSTCPPAGRRPHPPAG
jgi:hypothetical protein